MSLERSTQLNTYPLDVLGYINSGWNGIDVQSFFGPITLEDSGDGTYTATRLGLTGQTGSIISGGDLQATVDHNLVAGAEPATWNVPAPSVYTSDGHKMIDLSIEAFGPSEVPSGTDSFDFEIYAQPQNGEPPVLLTTASQTLGGTYPLSVPGLDITNYFVGTEPPKMIVTATAMAGLTPLVTYDFDDPLPRQAGSFDLSTDTFASGMDPLNFGDPSYHAVPGQAINFTFHANDPGEIPRGYTYTVDWGDVPLTAIVGMTDGGNGTVVVDSTGSNRSPGQQVKIVGTADYNGIYTIDSATADTFTITAAWNGSETGAWSDPNGAVQVFQAANDLLNATHTYAQSNGEYDNGLGVFTDGYQVTVTVTDSFGDTSDPETYVVPVVNASLQADTTHPGQIDLVFGGTNNDDAVTFSQIDSTTVQENITELNGAAVSQTTTYTGVTGHVIAYGLGGNDTIDGSGLNTIAITAYAGTGNDLITGGGANDTLYAGDGNDSLVGGAGNDTLIAGTGDDVLAGGTGSDSYVFAGSSALGSDTIVDSQETDPNGTGNILDFRQLAPDASNDGIALNLATIGTSQTVLPGVLRGCQKTEIGSRLISA